MSAKSNQNLDHWLNEALRRYGDVEPRAGLEHRIGLKLAGAAARPRFSYAWRVCLASAAIASVSLAIWFGFGQRRATPIEKARRTVRSEGAPEQHEMPTHADAVRVSVHQSKRIRKRAGAGVNGQKLSQFPSPTPLTEQELLFARYAELFPKQAMLLAKEQRQFEEGVRRAERDLRNSSPDSDKER